MAKITYITKAGEEIQLEASTGSLMELAVKHKVTGIDGDCGGVCSCATCHVHVAPAIYQKLEAPTEIESDMLEFDDNVNEYSRLCCQIPISETIDGITVNVAN
ncbi:2Fe-2S iron-sulfur cluster-binding protein [Maribacter sp. R86514]|uniref:2Fe-2S iron-sulfur cluster-binding protein n=1 Tax=Maribacter sp. R86514 TaxID=3093854 RepID=UPI0037C90446